MKKKAYILIFLFLIFLIVIAVAVFLIVAINKPKSDSGSITTYTISTLNENESVDNCEKLENGKFVCSVGLVEISAGETIEESFDVSIDNHKN